MVPYQSRLAVCAVLFGFVSLCPVPALSDDRVVYGDDDRLDLHQVTDAGLLKLADSTVALFNSSSVTVDPDKGIAQLKTRSYASEYGLCKDEPFYEQKNGAFCSGFLVGEDLLLTAGHCIRTETACKSTRFVFGFGIKDKNNFPDTVDVQDVYECKALVARTEQSTGADFAVIRLDRKVANHAPLALNRKTDPAQGTALVVIGHPAGLPTKVAAGASVRDPNKNGYFIANLDTYGGNSGSAVFNSKTHEVEGILVRGETDYKYDSAKGCYRSNICANDKCRGEDVTKISVTLGKIPE